MKWLGKLIAFASPRSDNYFALFNELTACTVRGAKVLARMSSVRDPGEFEKLFDEIKKTEGEADGVTRSIFLPLHKTFITPFDRWEIKDLATALDDMIDYMEDIPQRAGMTRLFAEVLDARALIRAKELYELFEEAVDRCEDAADVIHGVVLERI